MEPTAGLAAIEQRIAELTATIAQLETQMDTGGKPDWEQRFIEDQCDTVSHHCAGLIEAWQLLTGRTWEVSDGDHSRGTGG